MKRTKVIVALGTNSGQEEHMTLAKERLLTVLDSCRFTPSLWTEPLGIVSDRFLNAVATGSTALTQEELQQQLKAIERILGDTREQRQQGVVCMDIDLLQYGDERLKKEDWKRPYVQELVQFINNNSITP